MYVAPDVATAGPAMVTAYTCDVRQKAYANIKSVVEVFIVFSSSVVPTGQISVEVISFPGNKLPGYSQLSLRDRNPGGMNFSPGNELPISFQPRNYESQSGLKALEREPERKPAQTWAA